MFISTFPRRVREDRRILSAFKLNMFDGGNVPFLFLLLFLLILSDTKCDKVGSANVQKFHPNGRYGRRSVDSFPAESRTELGRLVFTNTDDEARQSQPMRSVLRSLSRQLGDSRRGGAVDNMAETFSDSNGQSRLRANGHRVDITPNSNVGSDFEHDLKLSKLLRCNYTGISNLYKCRATESDAD